MQVEKIDKAGLGGRREMPLLMDRVAAGFPSPADDYVEGCLDLNAYLVKHPAATFFVRVAGQAVLGAGIHPGDLLVVDRSLGPMDRNMVIAVVNGELTVKRFRCCGERVFLEEENLEHVPLEMTEEMAFEVWGVVTSVIHAL